MKSVLKYSVALAGLVSGIALSSGAWASDMVFNPGPYIGLGAGVTMPETDDIHILGPSPGPGLAGTDTPANMNWGTGYNIVGSVGYKMRNGFRPELEMGWRSTSLHTVNGNDWGGKEKIFGLMPNVLYDINTNSAITPYIGGGIGVARNRFDNINGGGVNVGPTPANYTGHDTNFQWQLIGGVSVPIAHNVALFADYRYIRLDHNRIHSVTNPVSEIIGHDDKSHNILAGIRISFGRDETTTRTEETTTTPPPAPMAQPAPQPAPPVPEKTLTFFDFDKANLRPDAEQTVREAADYAKNNHKTVIHVTGHTDTSGTADYNMALSKRRAMTVKAELIRLGIPASEIEVAWKGKSEPLIQTGDGVKEPQNRRVEIIYD